MNASYRLFFQDISVMVSIGIHDHERRAPQRYLVSVELLCRALPTEDRIDGTFDYDAVREAALRLGRLRHYDLQETFCRDLCAELAKAGPFNAVIVTAGKPDVYPDVAIVGCSVSWGTTEALTALNLIRSR